MKKSEKTVRETIKSDNGGSIKLIILEESTFIDEDTRGIELNIHNKLDAIFTLGELQKVSQSMLVSDGFGGTCDWCGEKCEESVFLELNFDFITLHSECYEEFQSVCSSIYENHKSDIVSFKI